MPRLSDLLDADWARLGELSGASTQLRKFRHAFSPRFASVTLIRLSQALHSSGWVRLAKLSALINFVLFGIEVPPRMPIGPGLVLMHTHGTVLGAASIGSNVTIYQQVTLGAREMDFVYTLSQRPIIEDGVVIGAGAKVLGGLKLGTECKIGANAVVLKDVPARHLAVGVPARIIAVSPKRDISTSLEA